MPAVDRYICDNPGCGTILYMEPRFRSREARCPRCRSALIQHGTSELAGATGKASTAVCPICGQSGMAEQHAAACPFAGQREQYHIPLATYLTDQVEVEAWDEKSSRWVPVVRAFEGLTGPEAFGELVDRHIPHMRLQAALIWESQPEHRFESLPGSETDNYSWRMMEIAPYPVLQVIHGPVQNPSERHPWPAHYYRFKPL